MWFRNSVKDDRTMQSCIRMVGLYMQNMRYLDSNVFVFHQTYHNHTLDSNIIQFKFYFITLRENVFDLRLTNL